MSSRVSFAARPDMGCVMATGPAMGMGDDDDDDRWGGSLGGSAIGRPEGKVGHGSVLQRQQRPARALSQRSEPPGN